MENIGQKHGVSATSSAMVGTAINCLLIGAECPGQMCGRLAQEANMLVSGKVRLACQILHVNRFFINWLFIQLTDSFLPSSMSLEGAAAVGRRRGQTKLIGLGYVKTREI